MTPRYTILRFPAAGLAVLGAVATLAGCGGSSNGSASPPVTTSTPSTTVAPPATTTTPSKNLAPAAKLILQLLKKPTKASLPESLEGSTTQATPLSSGSRKYHAAGAIVTTNGGALAGFLVFKKRSDALADLKAFPPNSGPNKIVARSVPGLPKPTYVLNAPGNGYVANYVVFVDGPVIVNTWAYGQKGKDEKELRKVVLTNARWALKRLAAARAAAG